MKYATNENGETVDENGNVVDPETGEVIDKNNEPDNQGKGGNGEPKPKQSKYSDEDIDKILSNNNSLSEQIEELKKSQLTDDKVNELIEKGKKQAKMSAKELEENQASERKKQLDEREQKINERLKKIDERDALNSTKEVLNKKQLPVELAQYISDVDEDKRKQNIDNIDDIMNSFIDDKVAERIKGKNNPTSSNINKPGNTDMTKEQFNKLPYAEQSKLLTENPEFYNKFLNV